MALDLYTKEDIRNGILSILIMAVRNYYASGGRSLERTNGIVDAVRAQAALYGLDWTALLLEARKRLDDGPVLKMLDAAIKSANIEGN